MWWSYSTLYRNNVGNNWGRLFFIIILAVHLFTKTRRCPLVQTWAFKCAQHIPDQSVDSDWKWNLQLSEVLMKAKIEQFLNPPPPSHLSSSQPVTLQSKRWMLLTTGRQICVTFSSPAKDASSWQLLSEVAEQGEWKRVTGWFWADRNDTLWNRPIPEGDKESLPTQSYSSAL